MYWRCLKYGIIVSGVVAGMAFGVSARQGVGEEIAFTSADGLLVSAYWSQAYAAGDVITDTRSDRAPAILLFHMAGSSATGEYTEIVPVLNRAGYHTLAVDLRAGGARLGATNKTAERFTDKEVSYCDAYPDMVAALDWIKTQPEADKIFALGSSFSAGLIVKLAGEKAEQLAGALAFSPASGAPMADCRPEPYLQELSVPLIAFRPGSEMAIESVQAQAATFRGMGIDYMEIADGRHGSLMLRPSQTGVSMDHAWRPVMAFLNGFEQSEAEEVALSVDGWGLQGDMIIPAGGNRSPAVLLLHGAAGERSIYRELARVLARRGIASLRIDLRAHGESVNKGRFQLPWEDHLALLEGTERDIIAALAFLKSRAEIDNTKIGIVGASYSGEFMAIAGRETGFESAYVALAPGSFSEESILQLDASGKPWYFLRAEKELSLFDDIFASIQTNSRSAEIKILPGDGHADELLKTIPGLALELADWMNGKLR